MKCKRCKTATATGRMFALCDGCFQAFQAHVDANSGPDGKYDLSDEEFEYLNTGTYVAPDGKSAVQVRRPN